MNATCMICGEIIANGELFKGALVEHVLVNHPERARHGGLFSEALGCFGLRSRESAQEPNEAHAAGDPELPEEPSSAAPAGPVLVVEDNDDVREAMLAVISNAGFSVRGAENGKQALEVLRDGSAQPSLILLDLMMPVMNGREFRERQLADAALSRIPVVVLTVYGRSADTAGLAGAEILGKPIELDRMLDTVRECCRRV